MRVAIVIDRLRLGGTESQFVRLAVGLESAGHDVLFLTLEAPDEEAWPLVEQLAQHRVRSLHLLMRGWKSIAYLPIRLRRLLRDFDADVLYTAMSRATALGAMPIAVPRGVPRLGSRRSVVSSRPGESPAAARLRKLAIRRYPLVVANSQVVASDSSKNEGLPLARYRVIHNCLSDNYFAAQPQSDMRENSETTLLCVGNLRPLKGHETLLQSLAELRNGGLDARLLLIGDGPLMSGLRNFANENRLNVEFLGNLPDPRPYYSLCDVYIQPSDSEGMSNALLEALASGCSIVATDVGGTREAVRDSAILVPPRNPKAVAAAVTSLMENKEYQVRLRQLALRQASRYTIQAAVVAHEEVFSTLVARKAKGPLIRSPFKNLPRYACQPMAKAFGLGLRDYGGHVNGGSVDSNGSLMNDLVISKP